MARTWQELFITGEDAPEPAPEKPEQRTGFFRRLRENLSKTREALGAELQATVFQNLDDETWERLEETLIYADVGATTTAKIVERLETEASYGRAERRRAAHAAAAPSCSPRWPASARARSTCVPTPP